VPFANSDTLQVGEWVIAVGSPLGLAQTVTAGIVSATGRKDIGLAGYEDFIQTDAAINPGNSGGALVNLDGELVGINTAIASEGGGYDGVCFAVPAAVVFPVADLLIREGKIVRPFLGVTPKTVDRRLAQRLRLAEPRGVLVQNMIRQGPAHRAGLRPGDVLIQWGEKAVQGRADLVNHVQATEIGSETTVIIVRESKQYRATVTLVQRPQNAQLRGVL
jgi:serine protease Do